MGKILAAYYEKERSVLRDFAAEKQVVLFTCHSSHARLLGGHCIELEIPA